MPIQIRCKIDGDTLIIVDDLTLEYNRTPYVIRCCTVVCNATHIHFVESSLPTTLTVHQNDSIFVMEEYEVTNTLEWKVVDGWLHTSYHEKQWSLKLIPLSDKSSLVGMNEDYWALEQ